MPIDIAVIAVIALRPARQGSSPGGQLARITFFRNFLPPIGTEPWDRFYDVSITVEDIGLSAFALSLSPRLSSTIRRGTGCAPSRSCAQFRLGLEVIRTWSAPGARRGSHTPARATWRRRRSRYRPCISAIRQPRCLDRNRRAFQADPTMTPRTDR